MYTPDTRIKFGQIEHISGVSVGRGAVLFSLSLQPHWVLVIALKIMLGAAFKIPTFEYNAGTFVNMKSFLEQKPQPVGHQDMRTGTAPQNNKWWTDCGSTQGLFYCLQINELHPVIA